MSQSKQVQKCEGPPFIMEASKARGQDRGVCLREGSSWLLAPSLPGLVPQASLAQWHQSDSSVFWETWTHTSLSLMCPQNLRPGQTQAEPVGCVTIPNPQTGLLERHGRGLLRTLPALQRWVLGVTGMGLVLRIKDSDNTQPRLTPIPGG